MFFSNTMTAAWRCCNSTISVRVLNIQMLDAIDQIQKNVGCSFARRNDGVEMSNPH
jgi:hypothetical protein